MTVEGKTKAPLRLVDGRVLNAAINLTK